jgi:hypothetical protein
MSEVIDAEHRRHEQLVAALVEPQLGEVHIAELLSRWLADREVAALVDWIKRARDKLTVRTLDLLARVVAAIGDATRDTEGRYHVVLGPTLVRHLLDAVPPEGTGPDGGAT